MSRQLYRLLKARSARAMAAFAVLVFLLHAGNYLYFFVDDEGIPFVYAQNLLEGRGLVYSVAEGRVEGYADFLHVVLATVILAATRLLALPSLSVFFVGKSISLACGALIVWLAGSSLVRLRPGRPGALLAALAVTALAGPLAVWSCSSLEAVPFALGVAVLVWGLCAERPRPAVLAAAAVFLALERIDGWVWAGAIGGAYFVLGPRTHRRPAFQAVLVPALVATLAMAVFRLAYFGTWAPTLVYAKVLFKLQESGQLVKRLDAVSYAGQLAALYGLVPLLVAGALALHAAGRSRGPRALLVAVLALGVYVAVVGDWMFGFRFFVPLIAPAAVLLGASVASWRPAAGWVGAVVVTAWSAVVAQQFAGQYVAQRHELPRQNFWAERSLEAGRFFGPYYSLIEFLKPIARPQELVSYNQAGLIPFVLDLSNIDTLGICSRYYARLPATDVVYTEVGRYEPMTPVPVISARRAYLLNRAPRFIVERTDLLRRANRGDIPGSLFGGYFTLRGIDDAGANAIYEWAGLPNERYRTEPGLFLENVVHVSNLGKSVVAGELVEGPALLQALPFLLERDGPIEAAPEYRAILGIRGGGAIARQIYIGGVKTDVEAELSVAIRGDDGRLSYRYARRLSPGVTRVNEWLPGGGGPASAVELSIRASGGGRLRGVLADVRVMAETPALQAFVRSHVPFEGNRSTALPGERRRRAADPQRAAALLDAAYPSR